MYSNEDLERFYFKYQPEALPHGQSLQTFCLNNNVPYNLFSKWYKDTRRKIVSVQVDDRPSALIGEEPFNQFRQHPMNPIRWRSQSFRSVRCMISLSEYG